MPRPKKKPDYNADQIMQEFTTTLADAFGSYDDRDSEEPQNSLNTVAAEFEITALKARKLLITAGMYSTTLSRKIVQMKQCGAGISEIMLTTGLSRASVHSYLPYTKISYNMDELSVNAARIRVYRERKRLCEKFCSKAEQMSVTEQEETLWDLLKQLQGCVFFTAKGLKFSYKIKGGEMFVNRKFKSITQATVFMAFRKTMALRGVVAGPKQLGTFGASYLYSVFVRIGVISSPLHGVRDN